ncbi:hypothetical protein ASZ90_018168 [hydrocarbon metagenome]|uniref:Uncharacterized protein n=1 Tax=hydrocarbon metagenome TaxID=938273 RepID=A0A0W8E7L1_9ZZZZ
MTMSTMYRNIGLNNVDNIPETFSELYNLAIELNRHISNSLSSIHPVVPDTSKKTIKNLLYYQQVEKSRLIELLHNELNNCYRAFYDRKKYSITVYSNNRDDYIKANTFITKSLDTFTERINNFDYICHKNKDLSDVDLLVLYLGLRDYCANFYQQLAVNYKNKKLLNTCQDIVVLIDGISDEIGLAYTGEKQKRKGRE